MPLLIFSTSLKPVSRSRILARAAQHAATAVGGAELIDLRDHPLPLCDGATFGLPAVERLSTAIRGATAVLIAAPVYNFDLNAAAKNLIEHTGKAWEDKVVGFLLAAGGQRSYMAAQSFAGSLALDFRSVVVPRFVYATRESFSGEAVTDPEIQARIVALVEAAQRFGTALAAAPAPR
ncbi:flavoprotein [Planctomycetota bacterium]|nr:flavoprotein [Planctomycetota bacterium]